MIRGVFFRHLVDCQSVGERVGLTVADDYSSVACAGASRSTTFKKVQR